MKTRIRTGCFYSKMWTQFNRRNQTKVIVRTQFTLLSTVKAMRDRSFFRTRPIAFFKQDPPPFPNKTNRLFQKTPTAFSEQDWSPFPNIFTEQDRLSLPNTERLHPQDQTCFFPNNNDRLFRIWTLITFSETATPTVFSEKDRPSFSKQDWSSLPIQTDHLLPNKTGCLFRTASSPCDVTCSQYKTRTHNDNCYC